MSEQKTPWIKLEKVDAETYWTCVNSPEIHEHQSIPSRIQRLVIAVPNSITMPEGAFCHHGPPSIPTPVIIKGSLSGETYAFAGLMREINYNLDCLIELYGFEYQNCYVKLTNYWIDQTDSGMNIKDVPETNYHINLVENKGVLYLEFIRAQKQSERTIIITEAQ